MDTFLKDVVDPAVITLITALVAYGLKVGLPLVVDLLLRSKAKFLVKAAESKFAGTGRGDEKYQYVADGLAAYAKKLLARIPDKRVQAYVQAAVTELHAELPAALKAADQQIVNDTATDQADDQKEAQKVDAQEAAAKTADQETTVQEQPTEQAAAQDAVKAQTEAPTAQN